MQRLGQGVFPALQLSLLPGDTDPTWYTPPTPGYGERSLSNQVWLNCRQPARLPRSQRLWVTGARWGHFLLLRLGEDATGQL